MKIYQLYLEFWWKVDLCKNLGAETGLRASVYRVHLWRFDVSI